MSESKAASGTQLITVCALIHDTIDGSPKVFMPRRSDEMKFMPGVYNLPGGHVEFGEELVAALKREIEEEFGLQIIIGEPFAAFTYVNDSKGSHSIEIIYFARFDSPLTLMRMDPRDHSEYKWVGVDELPVIKAALKGANDAEMKVVHRGLELLSGDNIRID